MIRSFTKSFRPPYGSRGMTYIPHQFDRRRAEELILEQDKKRIFAPFSRNFETKSVRVSHDNPLKKAFLPFFYTNGDITHSDFEGEIGNIQHIILPPLLGRGISYVQYKMWSPVTGTFDGSSYRNLFTYGGFTWSQRLVEDAISEYNIILKLKPFHPSFLDSDAIVDPFHKREIVAKEEAIEAMKNLEIPKIENWIKQYFNSHDSRVTKLELHFSDLTIRTCLLPFYILQYDCMPPRVIPALDQNTKVVGSAPISPTKSMIVAAAATGLVSLFFPQMALAARVAMIAGPSIATGLWMKTRLYLKGYLNWAYMDNKRSENASFAKTESDRLRRRITENLNTSYRETTQVINIPDKYYHLLGLTPGKTYTKKEVTRAFHGKVKEVHPDRIQGSGEPFIELVKARKEFYRAFGEIKRNPS